MNRSPEAKLRQRWYHSERWRKLRAAFLAAHPHCESCGAPAVVADHKHGHAPGSGWESRFWDPAALSALCHQCHATKSAREGAHLPRRSWFGHGVVSGRGETGRKQTLALHRIGSHPRTASPQSEKSQPDARASAAARLIERLRDRA